MKTASALALELTAACSAVARLFRGTHEFFQLTTNSEDDADQLDDVLQTEAVEFIGLTLESSKAVPSTVLERLRTARTDKKSVRLWKVAGRSVTEALIYFCNGIIFEIFNVPIGFAAELADDLEEWNRRETALLPDREGSRSAPVEEDQESPSSRKSSKKSRISRPAALARILGTLHLHVATERERARRRHAIGRLEGFLSRIPRVRHELQEITIDWIDLGDLLEEEFDRALAIEEAAVPRVGAAAEQVKPEAVIAIPQPPSETRIEQSPNAPSPAKCSHSDDFRSVNWFGTVYTFNRSQADCVRLLWENWEKGKLSVHQRVFGDALEVANDNYRLRDTFRPKKIAHRAWGSMIQRAGKGTFRLVEPLPSTESPKSP